jgi:hypothetical protein
MSKWVDVSRGELPCRHLVLEKHISLGVCSSELCQLSAIESTMVDSPFHLGNTEVCPNSAKEAQTTPV